VPREVFGVTEKERKLLGEPGLKKWINLLKICNRPIFSPGEVDTCFLCTNKFTLFDR
jgi:hypothetical protein